MILDDIVAKKRLDLARAREQVSLADLDRKIAVRSPARSLGAALSAGGVRLIAEIKKASPSRGLLCPDLQPAQLAGIYASNGAAAISVLTERDFFQGDLSFLEEARAGVESKMQSVAQPVPLLRKDFLFDPYQVYEARANGADAILLIAAMLDDGQLRDLRRLAHELGMQCLVEVHDQSELQRALAVDSEIIGINNRDLRTFKVDLDTTRRLAREIPEGKVIVAESGIHTRDDVHRLAEWGVNAMLIGEALVTAGDVAAKMKDLLS